MAKEELDYNPVGHFNSYEEFTVRQHKEILKRAGVSARFVANALGIHPSTLSGRFKREDGKALWPEDWQKIIASMKQTSAPDAERLSAVLVQEGILGADSKMVPHMTGSSASTFDELNMIDLCGHVASTGMKTLFFDDLSYLAAAWRTIGGEFDMQLTVILLEHRKKQAR